jgi:hypothetical protein
MALTPELQRIYSSAPNHVTFYEGLVLSHPNWSEPVAIITNTIEEMVKNLDGNPITYHGANFEIALPKRDDLGLVQLQVNFPIVTKDMIQLIELAEASRIAITATLTVYIDGNDDPQMTPIVLSLDNVAITEEVISGVATRIDLLNKTFPRNIVRPELWPGLYRT